MGFVSATPNFEISVVPSVMVRTVKILLGNEVFKRRQRLQKGSATAGLLTLIDVCLLLLLRKMKELQGLLRYGINTIEVCSYSERWSRFQPKFCFLLHSSKTIYKWLDELAVEYPIYGHCSRNQLQLVFLNVMWLVQPTLGWRSNCHVMVLKLSYLAQIPYVG